MSFPIAKDGTYRPRSEYGLIPQRLAGAEFAASNASGSVRMNQKLDRPRADADGTRGYDLFRLEGAGPLMADCVQSFGRLGV
jgi:hypothetical protein